MPRKSDRQLLLEEIDKAITFAIIDEDGDMASDASDANEDEIKDQLHTPIDDLFELKMLVESSRYLERGSIPSSSDFRDNVFLDLPPNEFRQAARMSKEAFQFVLSEIEHHPIFSNDSAYDQAPVWQQLAVTLDRLGNYGNGASAGRTMHLWGIGKGTCDLYVDRVLLALESIATKYVKWPSEGERRAMSNRMAADGFKGCVGFIDGTTIPLSQKPGEDGTCFYDRKHRYSINAQVVCDDRRRITSFFCGWAGSCGDSTVYREMELAQDSKKELFFSPGEYLIADSAYPADLTHNTIIPSYKSSTRGVNNEEFNTCVAHVRVVNEHTIGILKNRWGSLKELRCQIKAKEDMERVLRWIQGCVVLHNMLIYFGDEWADEDQSDYDSSDEDDDLLADFEDDDDPYEFRRTVKRRAIAKGREPGGILWHRARTGVSG